MSQRVFWCSFEGLIAIALLQRRYSTIEDLQNFHKLAQMSPARR